MASAIISPISVSPLAEIVPTDLVGGRDRLGARAQVRDHRLDGHVDAAPEVHRVHAGGHGLGALAHDRMRQDGRRRGAVAGDVVGLGGDLADHLRAHVLELVAELDLLGDGHAVLGRARRTEGLVEYDVAALGAEGDLHRVGEDIDALEQTRPGIAAELHFLCSHSFGLLICWKARLRRPSWSSWRIPRSRP
jgi:hypothetical protein